MNVLLTCAGRRNCLVRYFREALDGRGKVYAADANLDAAALQEADQGILVATVDQPGYFNALKDICERYQVRLLISLNDLELPLLARRREQFLEVGTLPIISTPDVIDMCFDKLQTFEFLNRHNFVTPRTYARLEDAKAAISSGEISFQLVVKPRWGTASIAIDYPENEEELELMFYLTKKLIKKTVLVDVSMHDFDRSILIQEYIDGEEFNLDIINDLDGNYVTTLVTHKLAVRAGETDRAITVDSDQLQALGAQLGTLLGHVGILDCHVIVSNGATYILELNPRFAGAYPFSRAAGVNIPAALIAWAEGKEPNPNWFRMQANVMSTKCDRLVTRKNS